MATDFVVDSSSPVSPSKSTLFPFLSGNDTQQRRPKAIGQITKTFSSFSITPTKHTYKPATTGKGKWIGSNTRTPSITSLDSELESTTKPVGKLKLRVINPDPQDSSDDDQDKDNRSGSDHDETTIATRTNIDVTPTNSVLTHDAVVGATSSGSTNYDDAPSTPIPTSYSTEQHSIPSPILTEQTTSSSLSSPQQLKQSTVIPTIAPKSTLVRRQSKTLDEAVSTISSIKPGFLPPLDLTPFDSSNFIPLSSSDSLHSSRSPYLRLSTTIEPAPALATPVNATPTTTTIPTAPISTLAIDSFPRADQISLVSFDRNTLTTMPGDTPVTRTLSNMTQNDTLPSTTHNYHQHQHQHQQHHQQQQGSLLLGRDGPSKYAKASYSLTNNPDALRLYRDMATKTRDKTVQYNYAKYLLEIAALYDQGREIKHNKLSSIKHSFGEASQRLRHELNHHNHRHKPHYPSLSTRPPSLAQSVQASRTPASPTSLHSFITTTTTTHTTTTTAFTPNHHPHETTSHRRKKRALEEEGIRWMKRLAKEKMPDAAYTIATWMDDAMYGFNKNPTKSFLLYDIAAKAGIRDAIYKMGLYYESTGDHANALQCIKKASDLGVVHATLKLAKVYLHGELGQRQNMTLALTILHQATNDADTECPEPPYMFGLILTNTYPKADIPSQVVQQYGGILACLPYFERAVHLGYPPAHSTLGSILEHGLYGLRVNYAQCYNHYAEAARRGDLLGMVGLSRLNNRGLHGPGDDHHRHINADESGWLAQHEPNEETAFYWCQKAAEQESPEGEFLLGWYYEIGLGTPRDHGKARWYYEKAAAAGNQDAQDRLYQDPFFTTYPNTPPKKETSQCVLM